MMMTVLYQFRYLNPKLEAAQLHETVELVKSQPVVVVVVAVVVVVVVVVAASSCRPLSLIQTRHDIPPSCGRTTPNPR